MSIIQGERRRRRRYKSATHQLMIAPPSGEPVELRLVPCGTTVQVVSTGTVARKVSDTVLRVSQSNAVEPGHEPLITATARDLVVPLAA